MFDSSVDSAIRIKVRAQPNVQQNTSEGEEVEVHLQRTEFTSVRQREPDSDPNLQQSLRSLKSGTPWKICKKTRNPDLNRGRRGDLKHPNCQHVFKRLQSDDGKRSFHFSFCFNLCKSSQDILKLIIRLLRV